MHKKTKIFILSFFIFIIQLFFQISLAKYVIEDLILVATIDIDCTKPKIELMDMVSSNQSYPTYVNSNHLLTGHIKVTEKNIIRNNLSPDTLKILVNNSPISVKFNRFSLISETPNEKIYEFSLTNLTSDGTLTLQIPEGIIEDKTGFTNESQTFSTSITIDNTPPSITFQEILCTNGKSTAQITANESVISLPGWTSSSDATLLSKEFLNPISYLLPITDYAQNSSEVLVSINNATNLSLDYGTFDVTSRQTFTSNGKISAPNTISSDSICKAESLIIGLSGDIAPNSLQGRVYMHTYWGEGATECCLYHKSNYYHHGFNPPLVSDWLNIGSDSLYSYNNKIYSHFGGAGVNRGNRPSSLSKPIPIAIAKQYLFGISGMQFKLNNTPDISIVYQGYVKEVGWLPCSSDGDENSYQHSKPFSSLRINLVPKTEKQYLIDFWNRDIGTHHID